MCDWACETVLYSGQHHAIIYYYYNSWNRSHFQLPWLVNVFSFLAKLGLAMGKYYMVSTSIFLFNITWNMYLNYFLIDVCACACSLMPCCDIRAPLASKPWIELFFFSRTGTEPRAPHTLGKQVLHQWTSSLVHGLTSLDRHPQWPTLSLDNGVEELTLVVV